MILKDLHQMADASRRAAWALAASDLNIRNAALLAMARKLNAHQEKIFAANAADVADATAANLAAPLLHRLKFREEKLAAVTAGLEALAQLPDPIGQTTIARELTEGLTMYRVACPIGVIGVIFESRPDALVQIASLALKSGNAVLLKGGREALRTNAVLCDCLREAAAEVGLPADFAQLLTTREDVAAMLREDELIDLIIPRGSNEFVRYIMDNSRIPVLGHADGICHVYVDKAADIDMAVSIAVDSKTQNVAVCNAMETLLVHRDISEAYLQKLLPAMQTKKVRLLGDENVRAIIPVEPADEADWATEYLDYTLSIRVVDDLDAAIEHINHYGSGHTDCIVTSDTSAAKAFLTRVDSAGVYHNVSTRFADGFVYGFGAEVGIATGKIHARGPMGLEGLTTYKYKLLGSGQLMAEMKSGARHYTHKLLNEECPL
ncbi:MAG: glutamate-5-semialdehyde dehydrogenase [Clostridia bacterium]|nr:glutamate-5-semialdehyde dehydrogenase [Clostridia bacterium]